MVKVETIVRLIVLLIALINQLLVAVGKSPLPFENETVNEFVSALVTVLAAAWAWWKNNSFTKEAIEADEIMKQKKAEKKE